MDFNRAADEQGFQKLRIAGDRRAVKDAKAVLVFLTRLPCFPLLGTC